jgi:ribose 5-phosphate isomerase B
MSIKIAIGSDHAGFELKEKLISYIKECGHEISDKGCFSTDRADYPDYGHAVAEAVLSEKGSLGILRESR